MTIPASRIANVIPSVLAAAGSALDLNGLILSESNDVPVGTMMPFASAADVGAYFGLTSTEYQMAEIYFQGPDNATVTPGQLYFARYATDDIPAYLRSGSLSGMTIAQLQAISGTLSINVDGAEHRSSSINLSTATSFAAAALLIENAFTSPDFSVSYNAQHASFEIVTTSAGSASNIAYASGPIAADLKLDAASGATLSQGADAYAPATAMPIYVAAAGDWVSFSTIWEPTLSDKSAFSLWSSQQNERYVYVGYDTDANAKVSGSTSTWVYQVSQAKQNGTLPVFGTFPYAAAVMSWIASIDFSRVNGRSTLKFQTFSGLDPYVSDATVSSILESNGYNYYGAYATSSQSFQFFSPGSMPGKWGWADSYVNQIWLNANLQLAMVNLLTSVGSVPYNTTGYALIDASLADPINSAISFGAIRTGVSLSSSQISQIRNAVGSDVSQNIITSGYYLQIVPATAAIRVDRASPSMTLYYADGGSIQKLTLASIEVQ